MSKYPADLVRRLLAPLLALLLLVVASPAPAAPPAVNGYVIANPAAAIDPADVRAIFLGGKQFAGSVRLVPVDNAAARDGFLAHVLDMTLDKYTTKWVARAFREGVTPPSLLGSDAEVVRFVSQNPGAVGYVSALAPSVRMVTSY